MIYSCGGYNEVGFWTLNGMASSNILGLKREMNHCALGNTIYFFGEDNLLIDPICSCFSTINNSFIQFESPK